MSKEKEKRWKTENERMMKTEMSKRKVIERNDEETNSVKI